MLQSLRDKKGPGDAGPQGPGSPEGRPVPDDLARFEEAVLCRACGHVVARRRDRISVAGSYRHSFFNPAGIVYEIGCFARAPGTSPLGPGSSEFSWFSGYSWRVAVCARCREHLGWLFVGKEPSFAGLIMDRLAGA